VWGTGCGVWGVGCGVGCGVRGTGRGALGESHQGIYLVFVNCVYHHQDLFFVEIRPSEIVLNPNP